MHISDKKGQTLVETALILIFLMLIIIGIMEFGRAMYFKNTANNAARGIARIAVVTPNLTGPDLTTNVDCSTDSTLTLDTISVPNFCSRFVTIRLPESNQSVPVAIHISQPNGSDRTGDAQTGDTVSVTITIPFETLTGFITTSPTADPNAVQVNLSTLVGQASMRYE